MQTFKLVNLGRAVKVTAASFIGTRPEVANPNLAYSG